MLFHVPFHTPSHTLIHLPRSLQRFVDRVRNQPSETRGFAVILLAAALSSMAGVYFEKILKGVKVSLWTRNLQLAAYSVITSFVPLVVSGEMYVIQEKGFFHGYTNMTWVCIIMNAGGGLLVGTVIKYGPFGTK